MTQAQAKTYIALLRGINVGGARRLPMNALTRLFEENGCVGWNGSLA